MLADKANLYRLTNFACDVNPRIGGIYLISALFDIVKVAANNPKGLYAPFHMRQPQWQYSIDGLYPLNGCKE